MSKYVEKTDTEWQALRNKYNPEDGYRNQRDQLYHGGSVKDHAFEPWEKDNEVCAFNLCGKLRSSHADQTKLGAPPKTSEFGQQYWRWLLKHGGVYSVYGLDSGPTLLILEHLETCELRDDLAEPSMGETDEFAGTDAGNSSVPAVVGKLACKCGQAVEFCDWGNHINRSYRDDGFDTVDWAVKHDGLTLGQVIFQVINEL